MKLPATCLAVLLAGRAGLVVADEPAATQDLETLRTTAAEFVKAKALEPGLMVTVEASQLDPRLRLVACPQPLQAFLPVGARQLGNSSVGVRCPGDWSVYVPVHVSALVEVIIASRPLQRGATLGAADLRHERRDLATLAYGYVLHSEQAVGKQLARSISEGTPLTPNLLTAPQWVKRGERVTVVAQVGGMEVRMNGEALTDGTEGALVRVRNLSSTRVVEGTVIAQGVIQVRL